MKKQNVWALLICCFFILGLVMAGCAPAKKPAPAPNNSAPKMTTPKTMKPMAKAQKIAQAVSKVPGVQKATCVVSGNTAYVGLDLDANLEKSKTDRVEKAAQDKALTVDSSVKRCVATSDADTVTRIKNIYQGMLNGKPASSFSRELGEIGRRINPKSTGS